MKKLVSLLLLFVMLMTMATFSATAEEPIEIIVARSSYPTGWPDSLDKDFIYQQILEKTGVSFKLVALDDYSQTLNLRIINDNAPDMFVINADTMRTYAAQDMLKDLTPYKNNELQCVFDTFGAGTDVPGLYYNDKMYLIPAANYDNNDYYTMYYRKDWADKLQLTPPTTVDELFNFCKTIMEADLDGNGIKDTKAFTGIKMQGLDAIANAYDVALGNYVNMSHYKGGVTVQKSIRTIQAEPTLPKRLRVAAYARVSCDKDTMLHSLAEQVSKYSRMIQSNTAWEYAGVYAEMLTPTLIQMHPTCTQIAP